MLVERAKRKKYFPLNFNHKRAFILIFYKNLFYLFGKFLLSVGGFLVPKFKTIFTILEKN